MIKVGNEYTDLRLNILAVILFFEEKLRKEHCISEFLPKFRIPLQHPTKRDAFVAGISTAARVRRGEIGGIRGKILKIETSQKQF